MKYTIRKRLLESLLIREWRIRTWNRLPRVLIWLLNTFKRMVPTIFWRRIIIYSFSVLMQRTHLFVKAPLRHSENFTRYSVILSSRSWLKMFHLRSKISLRRDSRGSKNNKLLMEPTYLRILTRLSIATEAWVTPKQVQIDSRQHKTLQLLWNLQWIENRWSQLQTSKIVWVDSRNLAAYHSIEHLLKRARKMLSLKMIMKEYEPKWTTLISTRTKKRKRCKLINKPICKTFSKERQISTRKIMIWNQIYKERTIVPSKLEVTGNQTIEWRMIDKITKMKSWRCSERLKRWTLIPQSRSNNRTFWSIFVDLRSVTS